MLRDKVHSTKNPENHGYQRGFASIVYNFFDKNSASCATESEIM